ncbi:MAG: GatB/YqeY domain-containing protein [Nitrospirota bacterium]
MTTAERIAEDFKNALKTGDKQKLSVLRMVKAAAKNKEIERGAPLAEEELQEILRTFIKRGKESIEQFSKAGREDLVTKETDELAVLQPYLPQQLSNDEVEALVKDVIHETGAKGAREMGKVMKAVMDRAMGRVDGKIVSELVRKTLEG